MKKKIGWIFVIFLGIVSSPVWIPLIIIFWIAGAMLEAIGYEED